MIGQIRRTLFTPLPSQWNAIVRDTTAAIERFTRDTLPMTIAWWLPKRVAYWAAIRVGSHATVGEHGHQIVPDLKFMEALRRWPR